LSDLAVPEPDRDADEAAHADRHMGQHIAVDAHVA
jgi:hypothetical protein